MKDSAEASFTASEAGKVIARHRGFPIAQFGKIVTLRKKDRKSAAASFRLSDPGYFYMFEELWAALSDVEKLLQLGAEKAQKEKA